MKSIIKNIVYTLFSPFFIRKGNNDYIYITFDDGPHPENTSNILNVLTKHNVHATFFMTGMEMEKHSDIVKQVFASGNTIGYHGYSHQSMRKQSLGEFIHDIKHARILEKTFNIRLKLYRPPFGDISPMGFIYLILNGWKIIMWSLDSRDSYDTEIQILKNVSPANLSKGEILLFHDDYEKTVRLLDSVIDQCKKANLVFGDNL